MPKPLLQSTGRRKRAVARVRIRTGAGAITINKRPIEAGEVVLTVAGREVARQHFSDKAAEAIELRVADAERRLHAPTNAAESSRNCK